MKRLGLINLVSLFLLAAVIVAFSRYAEKDLYEFEQLILSYATDYSTDASVTEILETGELSLDYADSGKTNLDPNIALNTFVDVFLMNYGMPISEDNREHVKNNFLPVFTVCTFDGYYQAVSRLTSAKENYPETEPAVDVDYTLVFGPKMPYKYINGSSSYALNFGGNYSLKMSGNIMTKEYVYPNGLEDREAGIREINKLLSTDISFQIDTINKDNGNWAHTFYIPTQLTSMTGVNPIQGPGIIAIVQNVDFVTAKPISAFSIGGGRIQNKRVLIGYVRDGIKYYCYADRYESMVPQPAIDNIFSSQKEAALASYAGDLKYLQ